MAASVKVNGSLIRSLREQRGIERSELASDVGVTPHRLYVIEVKEQRTRPSTLRKIAEVLGISPEHLVDEEALITIH